MPQGIVTQAIVERWLLRNGWLCVVQPSCLLGNLWFAANTPWKQMGIPVTWSSVLSTRLPCMLNERINCQNEPLEYHCWSHFLNFPGPELCAHCILPFSPLTGLRGLLMVPNQRRGNWGWEALGNTSLEEWLANDRVGSYFLVVERRVKEDSSPHPHSFDHSCCKDSGKNWALKKTFRVKSKKALACRGHHVSIWLWVKKGLEDSEAHVNVTSCPQGTSPGKFWKSKLHDTGRPVSAAAFSTQTWRLHNWPGRANRSLECFQQLKHVLFEGNSHRPNWLDPYSSSAELGLGCFHFSGKKPKVKEVLLLIHALGWSLGIPLSSCLVSLWHRATGKERHREISHKYILSTYCVPDTKEQNQVPALWNLLQEECEDQGGITLHCGPDSYLFDVMISWLPSILGPHFPCL